MYREKRGGGGSKAVAAAAEIGHVVGDRKRLNEALDKHLDRSSPSTSTNATRGLAVKDPRLSTYNSKDSRSSAPDNNNKGSDGFSLSLYISWHVYNVCCDDLMQTSKIILQVVKIEVLHLQLIQLLKFRVQINYGVSVTFVFTSVKICFFF